MNIKKLQIDLIRHFESKGLSSSNAIAKSYGMVQTTVYRSLYEVRIQPTDGIRELCNHAGININDYSVKNPSESATLMNALSLVWDGTEQHAKQLKRLILAAHSCKQKSEQMGTQK